MKQAKLQTRLFRSYLFLCCLILFLSAAFFYYSFSRQLTNTQIQAMNTLNSSFQAQVDGAIQDLDTVSVNINYSNISKNILDSSFGLHITDQTLNNMADFFISMSGTELKADQINLYDFYDHVLQVGLSTLVKESPKESVSWMEDAIALEGRKILSCPYETDIYSKSAKNKQWYFSLYRSFNNQFGRPVGAIETVKKCSSIFKSIISYQKKNKKSPTQIYIFDQNGTLIFPYAISEEEAWRITTYYQNILSDSIPIENPFTNPVTSEKEYLSRQCSSYTGYTYLTIQPEDYILEPVYHMLHLLLLVSAVLLLLCAFLSYRISRSLIRPIKHLKHIIQRLELDTLGVEQATQYPVSVNELEELYQAYQHMSDHLKESMNQLLLTQQRELETRTLALQTQINPHFYYNTLSSIMILAENGENEVVVQMCQNLSKIMRYITDTSSALVPLREEIDYVKKYLYCMKVRYQSSLNYYIDIDASLLEESVPKLLIQPLVENAIKYGTNCNPPWTLRIQSTLLPDAWQIDILDSGNGFSDEAIQKIDRMITDVSACSGMPELKIHGLGMANVYLRWKLVCKNDIIFSYRNTKDGHGRVSIGRKYKK